MRRRVERDIRSMRLGFLSALAITAVFGGGATWVLVSGEPDVVVVAVATWVFIAVTWAVSLTIGGGPRSVAPGVDQHGRVPVDAGPAGVWSYLAARWILWAITALLAVVAVWRWRALGRELEVLSHLRQGP